MPVSFRRISCNPMAYSLVLAVMVMLNGCTIPEETAMCPTPIDDTQPISITQGIQGRVSRLSGDQMPSIGEQANSGSTEFIQTTIWIFSDRIPGNGSPQWPISEAEQHPNLVRQVESSPDGCYWVELPPGEYTIFAQYGEILYLNSFQGDGSYASVEVIPNQLVEWDLTNTENAFF